MGSLTAGLLVACCGCGNSASDVAPPTSSPPSACSYEPPTGAIVYVATDGDDERGDGSSSAPWATVTHALDSVADGSTILVRPGEYLGRIRMRGTFDTGVVVRSEEPYRARFRNDGPVMTFYADGRGCQGIVVEGFDIAHSGPGASALVVHIDAAGDGAVSRITLRNNILHDSFNNDIVKINNGISDIVVERNLFFNQTGSDEHIDLNSAQGVVIQDNIFLNAFAESGRPVVNDTSSYIVVKDSNGADDRFTGSRSIAVRRNVFLRWQGNEGAGFLLFGEDGQPFHEVQGAIVENNLFLGDSPVVMRAPFGVKGSRDIVFRHNTTVGNLPSHAFAFRFNVEGSNPRVEGIELVNNVWSDPTGTMGAVDAADDNDFSDVAPDEIGAVSISNNLYWNGGSAVPDDDGEAVNPSDDAAGIVGDPLLGDVSALVVPHWDGSAFADGSTDVCGAFENLVVRYGSPAPGSAALDVADPTQAATDDILGRARSGAPDVGAVEAP